jgi:hypothetical protein
MQAGRSFARPVNIIVFAHPTREIRLRRHLDRYDLEGVKLILVVSDGDILAGNEGVHSETVSGLVIIGSGRIIFEHPARMLSTSRFVHEPAGLLLRAIPEAPDSAMLSVVPPEVGVDMTLHIKRRNEFVAVVRRAARKLF